jgi:hypothetical protein
MMKRIALRAVAADKLKVEIRTAIAVVKLAAIFASP